MLRTAGLSGRRAGTGPPPEIPRSEAPPNHSPRFAIDETALKVGVRTLASPALDFLNSQSKDAADAN